MRILIVFFFNLLFIQLNAQKIDVLDFEIINNDTIFFSDLPQVEILEFKSREEQYMYSILKRRVLKVYPYAIEAKKKLDEIELVLDTIPKKRKKRRYAREITRWIKEEYADRLKKLTMSEGRILVKLIYRETNITSYQIVKTYRGMFNAFFWQAMARIWDNNLKTEYDPINIREDMLIESIIIEAKHVGIF
jgi:hypothetical protein